MIIGNETLEEAAEKMIKEHLDFEVKNVLKN